jgi:hypothetical protein
MRPLHMVRCSAELLAQQKPELVTFIVQRLLGPDRHLGSNTAIFKQDTDDPLEQAAYSLFYVDGDKKLRQQLSMYIRNWYTLDSRTGQVRRNLQQRQRQRQRGRSKGGDSDDDSGDGDDISDSEEEEEEEESTDDDDDLATDSDQSCEEASDDDDDDDDCEADWNEQAASCRLRGDDEMPHFEAHEESHSSNFAGHASIRSTAAAAAAAAADDDLLAVEKRKSGQAQRQLLSHHHHHDSAKRKCGSNIASDGSLD